jgi:hypothetical protein
MTYVLPDEARPGALGNYVVRPSAPLMASMIAGAWLAWPWFAFNAYALGSPTRRRELGLCGLATLGTAVLAAVLIALVRGGWLETDTEVRLGLLVISTWKVGMAYWLHIVQNRTFHIYEYYKGVVRNPAPVLIAGFWLRPLLLDLSDDPFWIIIIAGGM